MTGPANTAAFDAWAESVDALCRTHLACSWADLCGDLPPLRRAFDAGQTPIAFVMRWARKYDLDLVDYPAAIFDSR